MPNTMVVALQPKYGSYKTKPRIHGWDVSTDGTKLYPASQQCLIDYAYTKETYKQYNGKWLTWITEDISRGEHSICQHSTQSGMLLYMASLKSTPEDFFNVSTFQEDFRPTGAVFLENVTLICPKNDAQGMPRMVC